MATIPGAVGGGGGEDQRSDQSDSRDIVRHGVKEFCVPLSLRVGGRGNKKKQQKKCG